MSKKKNFKAGDIVKHHYQYHKDVYDTDKFGERRFVRKDVVTEVETFLIIGHDGNGYFIVTAMGDVISFQSRRYFSHGGFDKCFKVLANYVNDNCIRI